MTLVVQMELVLGCFGCGCRGNICWLPFRVQDCPQTSCGMCWWPWLCTGVSPCTVGRPYLGELTLTVGEKLETFGNLSNVTCQNSRVLLKETCPSASWT